jgi:hypothetical protein
VALKPEVLVIKDLAGGDIVAGGGPNVIILGEAQDGPSLNVDGKLIEIGGSQDVINKLGPILFSNPAHDVAFAYLEMAGAKFWWGRVIGTGGVKALVNLNDFNGSPAQTVRAEWNGVGAHPSTSGLEYKMRISRGRGSTTDTGAGRVDTKYELLDPTNRALTTLDGVNMITTDQNYAVSLWNDLGALCRLVDLSPSDTYQNTDEPAVGTYNFTLGANPIAATTTERQLAADALALQPVGYHATVGVWGWPSADVNYLASKVAPRLSTVVSHLADGATPSSATTHINAITANRDSVAVFSGWGVRLRNSQKRVPGLPQVLAMATLAAQTGDAAGRSVNLTGANVPDGGWLSFDAVTEADRSSYATPRCNPLYSTSSTTTRVVVGDVLTLEEGRYSQWGVRRADNLILRDVLDFLNNVVNLRPEYPFARKVNNLNVALTLNTFAKIKQQITALFESYPATLLGGAEGIGWAWAADGVNTQDGFDPQFKLGTEPAGVARRMQLLIGQVGGRFAVVATEGGN